MRVPAHFTNGPATKPYLDEHWKQVHCNTWSGQGKKKTKPQLIPHLGHSIMREHHNKWMVFWSGNGTLLASGQSSEEQLHPTIFPWPMRRWERQREKGRGKRRKKKKKVASDALVSPGKHNIVPLSQQHLTDTCFSLLSQNCIWDKSSCVTLNYKTWTFHSRETHFKRERLKEVTEMRNKKKRGKSSDKY